MPYMARPGTGQEFAGTYKPLKAFTVLGPHDRKDEATLNLRQRTESFISSQAPQGRVGLCSACCVGIVAEVMFVEAAAAVSRTDSLSTCCLGM